MIELPGSQTEETRIRAEPVRPLDTDTLLLVSYFCLFFASFKGIKHDTNRPSLRKVNSKLFYVILV